MYRHCLLRRLVQGLTALVLGSALGLLAVGWRTPVAAHADPLPFTPRYSTTGYAGVEQTGNTLLSCLPDGCTPEDAPLTKASYVDTDGDPLTFNSSSAQVAAPPGAQLDFVGLYWLGDSGATGVCVGSSSALITAPPSAARANQVLVKVGTAGYVGVLATSFASQTSSNGAATIEGFADITRLFASFNGGKQLTSVPLTVGNVQLGQGIGCTGGWSVVLVYSYPAANHDYAPTYRLVSVCDGLVAINGGGSAALTLDGFRAPAAGNASVGLILDRAAVGAGSAKLQVNGATVPLAPGNTTPVGSTVAGPARTIAGVGPLPPVAGTASPLGVDSPVLAVPTGAIPTQSSAVTVAVAADAPGLLVGGLVFATDTQPLVSVTTTLTGAADYGDVTSGTKIIYTVRTHSLTDAPIGATTITATLPAGLVATPGSVTLDGSPVGGPDPIGAGGVSVALATLPTTEAVLSFTAVVASNVPAGVPLASRAVVDYTMDTALVTRSAPVTVLPGRIDLALTQSVDQTSVTGSEAAILTLALVNQGAVAATGVSVSDVLPAGLSLISADADQGDYAPNTGNWLVGTVPAGATVLMRVTVGARLTGPVTNLAEVNGADQPDVDSVAGDAVPGEDDLAAATMTVTMPSLAPSQAPTTPGPDVSTAPTRTAGIPLTGVVTLAGGVTGAAIILVGAMVLISALRRRP